MKVLVLGTPGQLGHELMRGIWPAGVSVSGVGYPDFDMGQETDVRRVVAEHTPDVVVNATAYTAVDKAEKEPDAAFAVNRDGPLFLARDCDERGIPLIHVSTDYVFDGAKTGRYVEDDPYDNVMNADISVSTIGSAGTGLDIPDLTTVILTVAINSSPSNIQGVGRLRQLKDKKTKFIYLTCSDIPKHREYHERKKVLLKEKVLTFNELSYPKIP